jgi:hypothetical protein
MLCKLLNHNLPSQKKVISIAISDCFNTNSTQSTAANRPLKQALCHQQWKECKQGTGQRKDVSRGLRILYITRKHKMNYYSSFKSYYNVKVTITTIPHLSTKRIKYRHYLQGIQNHSAQASLYVPSNF